ncbi:hypothetical protein MtrunA17_Chr4g0039931 [Medicago truncatula]|uniref:Uncharacterized protein n=1 Tax=Medicago truncatula TaxID=3880 RepID=A0A396IAG2_MEDTR|nr:hypothetical protein MtrunA17_Chr4g0039931 [Medicago truncatula]
MEASATLAASSSLTSYSNVVLIMLESLPFSITSIRTLNSVNPRSKHPPSTTSTSLMCFSLSILVNFSFKPVGPGKPDQTPTKIINVMLTQNTIDLYTYCVVP